MPAVRRNRESVAPVDIEGITGTPGHIAAVTDSTARITSGVSGDAGLGKNRFIGVTVILSLASAPMSVRRTSSSDSPGSTRQLTTALAVWGSALLAWPPSSRVATHVVRSRALKTGPAPEIGRAH